MKREWDIACFCFTPPLHSLKPVFCPALAEHFETYQGHRRAAWPSPSCSPLPDDPPHLPSLFNTTSKLQSLKAFKQAVL